MKVIRYIPVLELSVFISVCILSTALYLVTGFHIAILIFTILFANIFLLGGANFIKIYDGKISITYCYIIIWRDTFELKNLVKIESHQTFENGSLDAEAVFYEFRRTYQLQFKNEKGKLTNVEFKIANKTKEVEIVTTIKNAARSYNL